MPMFTEGINPNFRIRTTQQQLNELVPSPFTNLFEMTHDPNYLQGGNVSDNTFGFATNFLKGTTGQIIAGISVAVVVGLLLKRR